VTELAALQADILTSAQRLVKPGGRLIYVTCSLLAEENELQVERFLESHTDFKLVPIAQVWAETVGTACPADGGMLRLTTARHHTDGFFVAIMERAPAAKSEKPPT
jgi:16S rRNA (cytosine967-C5)-methyltransferase